MRDGPLLPRPRARADRRLPRAPGRALRARRGGDLRTRPGKPILTATELAVADPDNAGPADGPRDRPALLPVVAPRRHRARAPLAVRARAPATERPADVPIRGGPRSDRRTGVLSPWPPARGPALRTARGRRRPRQRRRRAARHRCGRRGACRSRSSTPWARSGSRRALDAELGTTASCAVVADGAGRDRDARSRRRDRPRRRRSSLTAAAALARLGPDFTLRDQGRRSRRPANGSVDRLWLVGSGDPVSRHPSSRRFCCPSRKTRDDGDDPAGRASPTRSSPPASAASPVASQGDDSRYETLRYLPTWKDDVPHRRSGRPARGAHRQPRLQRGSCRGQSPSTTPPCSRPEQLARACSKDRGVDGGRPFPGTRTRRAARSQSPRCSRAPLHDLIASMLSRRATTSPPSCVTREIGMKVGEQGTTAAGTQAIADEAARARRPRSTGWRSSTVPGSTAATA